MLRRAVLVTSVLLLLAVLYLWSRTFSRVDSVEHLTRANESYSVSSYRNGIELLVLSHPTRHPLAGNPSSSAPPHERWSLRSQTYEEINQELVQAISSDVSTPTAVLTTSGTGSLVLSPSSPGFPWIRIDPDSKSWTWMAPNSDIVFQRRTSISISLWLPLTLFALPIVVEMILPLRRLRRRAPGGCPVCGYDLRASPGRCPECGTTRLKVSDRAG